MIAEAACFRAEKRGFLGGNAAGGWLQAEAEIDRMLREQGRLRRKSSNAYRGLWIPTTSNPE